MNNILIIEDDLLITKTIQSILNSNDYKLTCTTEGKSGIKLIKQNKYDLLILDLKLPDISGYIITKFIRNNNIDLPILVINGNNKISDMITAFQLGVDDYLKRPFNTYELKCRVDGLLNRPPYTRKQVYKFQNLVLDCNNGVLKKNKKEIILQNKQFEILKYLFDHPNHIVTKDELLTSIWEYDTNTLPNTIDVHISKLRKDIKNKLNFKNDIICTIHSKGYKLAKE